MPRPLRPIDDGLVYHVINRGNNRQPVFFDEGDYLAFLRAVGDLKERKPFELYGYCLRSNHIHLVLRPVRGNISRVVQSLLVSHTQLVGFTSTKSPMKRNLRQFAAATRRGCLLATHRGSTGWPRNWGLT